MNVGHCVCRELFAKQSMKYVSLFPGLGVAHAILDKNYNGECVLSVVAQQKKQNDNNDEIAFIKEKLNPKEVVFAGTDTFLKKYGPDTSVLSILQTTPCELVIMEMDVNKKTWELFEKGIWPCFKVFFDRKLDFLIWGRVAKTYVDQVCSKLGVPPTIINMNGTIPLNRKFLFWTNIPIPQLSPGQEQRPFHTYIDSVDSVKELVYARETIPHRTPTTTSEVCFFPSVLFESGIAANVIFDERLKKYRKFSFNELERLWGLPKEWSAFPNFSDRFRYVSITKALPVPLFEHIFKHMCMHHLSRF